MIDHAGDKSQRERGGGGGVSGQHRTAFVFIIR